MAWLIIGLGNPGDRYATTRHNAGAMVLDILAERTGDRFKKVRFIPVDLAESRSATEQLLLARSHAFMNESGPSYASLARKRGIEADHAIVVYDDIDLAFGSLRVKQGGGSTHNGVKSLRQALGSDGFFHVRVGVGRPQGRQDPADFVLDPFSKNERDEIAVVLQEAADAAVAITDEGLEAVQNRVNR